MNFKKRAYLTSAIVVGATLMVVPARVQFGGFGRGLAGMGPDGFGGMHVCGFGGGVVQRPAVWDDQRSSITSSSRAPGSLFLQTPGSLPTAALHSLLTTG
jgi:hypothetical protein